MTNSSLQQWIYRSIIISSIILIAAWMVVNYIERNLIPLENHVTAEIKRMVEGVQEITRDSSTVLDGIDRPLDVALYVKCRYNERRDFENVLSRLGTGLTSAELQQLQSWFDRCGTVVAHRIAYIAQEVRIAAEHLDRLVAFQQLLSETLRNREQQGYFDIDVWHSYADAWQKYAVQQFILDELQRSLIDARAAGVSVEDSQITDLLMEVEIERNTLSEYQVKVRELEKKLEI